MHTHTYVHILRYVRTYVCTFVCMYVRMYVCTCILHIGGDAIEKAMHSYPGLNEDGVWNMANDVLYKVELYCTYIRVRISYECSLCLRMLLAC